MTARVIVVATGKTGPSGGGGGGGATALSGLSDVTITAAAAGDILRHNGTAWVDVAGSTLFDPAGTTSTAITAIKNGVAAGGDTLFELDARIAAVEAIGSLATDAELIAAVAALLGSADTAGDTLGELQALIGLRLLKSANLSDLPNAGTARTNLGLAIGTDVEAHDADLTTIAALTPSNDDVLQRKAGAWTNRTIAQLLTDLGLGSIYQPLAQAVNAQTGTTYTLVAGDVGKLVSLSNASGITLTVPQDSDATVAVGTYVDLYQLGAGQVTVAAGTGATLRVSGLTAKARAQYSRLGVQKVSANTWSLYGDLAAS